MKPNIYFDINGVIEFRGFIAYKFKEFLKFLIENNYDIYWLTTHCTDGNSKSALFYLSTITDDTELLEMFKKVKPTSWKFIKPEVFTNTADSIWYEDRELTDTEREYLQERNISSFYRKVDLNFEPDFWVKEVDLFKKGDII